MTDRRALLIAVPRCDDSEFTDIGAVVRADIESMRLALQQSGYSVVDTFGCDDGPEPTGSRIRARIRRACDEAPPDSVLLLYFSGHGVTVDGRDYLVPSDAYRDAGAAHPDAESLVPVMPSNIERCRARLVTYFVDACRDDPASPTELAAGGGMSPYLAAGDFVLVNGCRPGQRCLYGDAGSVFTQALAEVLDRRNPARTLSKVLTEVERQMRRKAHRTDGLAGVEQLPDIRPTASAEAAAEVSICDGDEMTEAWRRVVDTTALWERCADGEAATERVVEAVRAVIDDCAQRCQQARAALSNKTGIDDPWFDQNYPGRVLRMVAQLLGPDAKLEPHEVGMLVAAPFLYEAVLVDGLHEVAGIQPHNFTRTYQPGARTDLEIVHDMYPHVVRRAEGLHHRGQQVPRDTLAMWLAHRWLVTRASLWKGPAAKDACRQGADLLGGCVTPANTSELPRLVETLLRAASAEPADQPLKERLAEKYFDERWRGLAALLWLAATLAADVRRMPPVIADHIGTQVELPLVAVKAATDRLGWQRQGADCLDLQTICDHPALDVAFEDVVAQANAVRATLDTLGIAADLAAGLPARFTAEGLRAERREDGPVYEKPVPRFQLSEEKVRELLMGRQLYGDPSLAIRELYQNALDACRYRATRTRALEIRGRRPTPWQGLITFRQGMDGDREYIECEDNGVGMSVDTLKHVFANAGERFVYQQEYRAEQAEWQSLDPPLRLVSNSQFGIGVFSYFMLADEITVITRPVMRNGIPHPHAHRVHIASSGSLFQITRSDDLINGGTRIRLYLTGEERVSVLRTMRKLLWSAEYRVEVSEQDSGAEAWEPEELRYPDQTVAPLKVGRDLWWVTDEGGLAADGLRTNEEIFGLIVNLRDVHRPQFTVDRKTLRNWDTEWVDEQITRSLPELMEWPGFTLSWLWKLTESAPAIAQRIFAHASEIELYIPVGESWVSASPVPIGTLGCLPSDKQLFSAANFTLPGRWFASWRLGSWATVTGLPTPARGYPATQNSHRLPIACPADAQLLQAINHFGDDNIVDCIEIIGACKNTYETIADQLRRISRYAITGLNVSALRDIPKLTTTLTKENHPLLYALMAWAPPGEPGRRAVAGPLVTASAKMNLPLGEVLTRAAQLAPEEWVPPDIELGALADHVCTAADELLVGSGEYQYPRTWVKTAFEPVRVVNLTTRLGRSVDEVLRMCDRLEPLGVAVAGRGRYPTDLDPVETDALRQIHTVGARLSPLELATIAARAGATLHSTYARLTRLSTNGLLSLPDISNLPDLTPGPRDLSFIEGTFIRNLDYGLSQRRLLTGRAVALQVAYEIYKPNRLAKNVAIAQTIAPLVDLTEPITFADLVALADQLDCSVGEATEKLAAIFPRASLPTAPSGPESPTPSLWVICGALIGDTWKWTDGYQWEVHAGPIINSAFITGITLGGFLAMLAPYRSLGAPLPDLDEANLHVLGEAIPDEYDADMLLEFDMDGEQRYLSAVDPLQLVRIAGRLGWSPAEAHRRLARVAPLGISLDYPAERCPDDIVRWQDLLLLTTYFDGQQPAVSGAVTHAHVAAAATETEESPQWIRERLRHYAGLFALVVPEETADV